MRTILAAAAALLLISAAAAGPAATLPKPQIMVVGVAHLVSKHDLHNSTWGSSDLTPAMQAQIKTLVADIARFKPTKVMIEAEATNPKYVAGYRAYRAGTYTLGANEDYQFGYRLAGMMGLPTIYPIDSTGNFPFDYESVQRAAAKYHQTAVLAAANRFIQPLVDNGNALERADRLIDVMRYLNSPQALARNSGWYLYVNAIGKAPNDYAGQVLTSFWYARNLQILANITQALRPGDRAVVFIGQGHAAMLRPMIDASPNLLDVDPEPYLR